MTTSAKVRWALLLLSLLTGVCFLFLLADTGRFYCALALIIGFLFYYLAERPLDNLFYGEKLASALKEAKALKHEYRKLVKKCRPPLGSELLAAFSKSEEALDAATKARDLNAIRQASDELSKLIDKNLSFKKRAAWRDVFDPIAIAVLLALLLRGFVVEAFEIPSGSMIPTLLVGDKIFVNKLVYNVRLPFFNKSLLKIGEPHRGDVAVFVYPHNPSDNFVKRVIALPGDTVEVKSDFVYVGGKALARRNIGNSKYWDLLGDRWYENQYNAFEERSGQATYTVIQDPLRMRNDYAKHTIPEGYIFVMGDNRDNSSDSREWGLVPMDHLVGKAMFIWWSKGPQLHKERFFTWVD